MEFVEAIDGLEKYAWRCRRINDIFGEIVSALPNGTIRDICPQIITVPARTNFAALHADGRQSHFLDRF